MLRCSICLRRDRSAIDSSMAKGASYQSISDAIGVSVSALHRHWVSHGGLMAELTAFMSALGVGRCTTDLYQHLRSSLANHEAGVVRRKPYGTGKAPLTIEQGGVAEMVLNPRRQDSITAKSEPTPRSAQTPLPKKRTAPARPG